MKRPKILAGITVGCLFVGVVALALTVSMTGSGSLGPVAPGWSVVEECTPHVPGDTVGSVGSAQLTAGATSTSRYVADNPTVLTHDGYEWYGTVESASEFGLNSDVSLAGRLGFAVADATVAPVWAQDANDAKFVTYGSGTGQVAALVDMAVDPVDSSVFIASVGTVNGVDRYKVIKFDADGNYVTEFGSSGSGDGQFGSVIRITVGPNQEVWVGDVGNRRIQKFTRTSATVYTFALKSGSAGSGNGQFDDGVLPVTTDPSGNVYVGDRGNNRIQKFNSSGTYQAQVAISSVVADLSPFDIKYNTYTGQIWATTEMTVSATSTGRLDIFNTSLALQQTQYIQAPPGAHSGISSVSFNSDGTFWATWGKLSYAVRYNSNGVAVGQWQSQYADARLISYPITLVLSADDVGYVAKLYAPTEQTLVAGFDYRPVPLSEAIQTYLEQCDANLGGMSYDYQAASDPDVVFPGWTGNVWAKLKELCTLYSIEIVPVGDTITVRDLGSASLTLRNNTPVVTTPIATSQGQKIIATVQQPIAGGGVMWDAADYGGTYSVDVGQAIEVVVSTDQHPVSLAFPVAVDTLPLQSGQYYVVDSTGTQVPAATWNAAAAKVEAQLIGPQQILLRFFGPASAISGYTGPFYFASGRSSESYPTITVGGNGVRVDRRTITLYTPADPARAQEVAFKFDSPFLDTIDRCYDRMNWAVDAASSPSVEIRFDIPSGQLAAFGEKLGALVTYESSIYRVKRIERRAVTATVTATRYTTLSDLDAAWSGQSNTTRDSFWSGYSSNDRQVQPLLTSR